MEEEFILFKKFDEALLADTLIAILEKHDIDYQVEETLINANSIMSANFDKHYLIKIHPDDVLLANQAITEEQIEDSAMLANDVHLADFTNEELNQVIEHEDESSSSDYQLAQRILVGRGEHIDEATLATQHQQNADDISGPQPKHTARIIVGYFAALLGGIFGILIGWNLSSHKRLLPNGKQIYAYNEADRQQGRQIIYLGVIVLLLLIAYRIYKAF